MSDGLTDEQEALLQQLAAGDRMIDDAEIVSACEDPEFASVAAEVEEMGEVLQRSREGVRRDLEQAAAMGEPFDGADAAVARASSRARAMSNAQASPPGPLRSFLLPLAAAAALLVGVGVWWWAGGEPGPDPQRLGGAIECATPIPITTPGGAAALEFTWVFELESPRTFYVVRLFDDGDRQVPVAESGPQDEPRWVFEGDAPPIVHWDVRAYEPDTTRPVGKGSETVTLR